MNNFTVYFQDPLDDDVVRLGITNYADHTVNDGKPYKNTKLYAVRDHLSGEQVLTMCNTIKKFQHNTITIREFRKQLEKELPDIDFDTESTDVAAIYNMLKPKHLPSSNKSQFWRAVWGIFTAYMDIVEKHKLIQQWNKDLVFTGLFQ